MMESPRPNLEAPTVPSPSAPSPGRGGLGPAASAPGGACGASASSGTPPSAGLSSSGAEGPWVRPRLARGEASSPTPPPQWLGGTLELDPAGPSPGAA